MANDRIHVNGEVSGVQIKPGNNSQIKARLIITFDPDMISWESLKEIAKRGSCEIDITALQRSLALGEEPTALNGRKPRARRGSAASAQPEPDGDDEGDGGSGDSFGDLESIEDAQSMLEPEGLPA